jgi:hypothetical protein
MYEIKVRNLRLKETETLDSIVDKVDGLLSVAQKLTLICIVLLFWY